MTAKMTRIKVQYRQFLTEYSQWTVEYGSASADSETKDEKGGLNEAHSLHKKFSTRSREVFHHDLLVLPLVSLLLLFFWQRGRLK